MANVVQSTKAIAGSRYKAVNVASVAVMTTGDDAVRWGDDELPVILGCNNIATGSGHPYNPRGRRGAGGDDEARAAAEFGLTLRTALVQLTDIRAQNLDVRVARFAPSENLTYAMFCGGGIAWADAAMKRGEYAVGPAPPGAWPDLSGLWCHFEEFRSMRGLILSVLVLPCPGVAPAVFRTLTEEVVALIERSPERRARPLPPGGPRIRWPPQGALSWKPAWRPATAGCAPSARAVADFAVFRGDVVPALRIGKIIPKPICTIMAIPVKHNATII